MKRTTSIILMLAVGAGSISGIVALQNRLTIEKARFRVSASMSYLPSSEKLKPFFLGFHTAFADFLWIKTTIYFGSHSMSDNRYLYLVQMLDMVTRFNPHFYPAYEFAGLLLPQVADNLDAAKIILQRGISADVEKKWKLFFYLGMLYHRYDGDDYAAAYFIASATQQPGAPIQKLAGLAATLYEKTAGVSKAEKYLNIMYAMSENPEVRRYLEQKMQETATASAHAE
jgi:hypothetical protein